jgi:hypothetical protein
MDFDKPRESKNVAGESIEAREEGILGAVEIIERV